MIDGTAMSGQTKNGQVAHKEGGYKLLQVISKHKAPRNPLSVSLWRRVMPHISSLVFAVLLLFVSPLLTPHSSLLYAQAETATISGLVTDSTGAIMIGAEVSLLSVSQGTVQNTLTNNSGIYVFPSVQPGQYQIRVHKPGFKQVDFLGLIVNVQDHIEQNFGLQVGSVSESVTVEAGGLMVNTESAAVGTVVDRKYVENMPLNGRSFQDLILLTPGVVTNSPQSPSTNGVSGEFSVNGQRTESNYYTVDGVGANIGISPGVPQGNGTTGSLPGATALGTTQALVSVDALQEFRVQSSTYSAEYGRNPGGQFSFVTRSGTNDWHGTAFDYLRNNDFDANNWFNDLFRQPEPPLRQNDFGGSLGGPIEIPKVYDGRDQTFFFLSYEGLRVLQPHASTIEYVPDSALRQGTAAPLEEVLNAFPVANGPEVGNGLAEFVGTWSNPSSLNAYGLRLDRSFGEKLHVFFRFGDTDSKAATRQAAPSQVQTTSYTSRTYTFGATTAASGGISNEFRLNSSSNTSDLENTLDNFGGAQPASLGQLQQVNTANAYLVTVGLFLGPTPPELAEGSLTGVQRQWNIIDSVNIPLGRHQLKFGVDYRRLTPTQEVGAPQSDYFFFSEGAVEANRADIALSQNFAKDYPLFTNFSAFALDEWKITPRLNLSLGLRWEINPALGVTRGPLPLTVQGTNDLGTMTLAPAGTEPWKTTWFNFAPRLGAAYVLRGVPGYETVLRGGGGVFFDTGQQLGGNGFFAPNYASITQVGGFFGVPASFPLPPSEALPPVSQNPAPPYLEVSAFSPHLQLPYTIQWNVAAEQALGRSQAVSVTYVGSRGGRLLEEREVKVTPFNPNFGTVQFYENGLTADYDAVQLQFRRKISNGFTALASYTYGHSIDYGSTDYNLPYIRGNSDFDVRHNFSSAFSYDLPSPFRGRVARAVFGRWGVDDRFTARTGFPVTLGGPTLVDPSTGESINTGLNIVPGQPFYLYASTFPGGRAINPGAFTAPPPGGLGDAPRNFMRGFGVWQMDLAVRREFPIYERLKLQFRAEAFNVFNHPNFGYIDPFLGDPTFGQATSTLNSSLGVLNPLYQAGGPRSLQFALKLIF